MSGYNGWSKSNRACDAEANGRYPASVAARVLGVPVEFVRAQGTSEWHHTSSRYNRTDYYDVEEIREHLETPEGQTELAGFVAKKAAQKKSPGKEYKACRVEWLEWSGTRKHPRATECSDDGATVLDKGGKMVDVTLASGKTFRKCKTTTGFKILQDGKRVYL